MIQKSTEEASHLTGFQQLLWEPLPCDSGPHPSQLLPPPAPSPGPKRPANASTTVLKGHSVCSCRHVGTVPTAGWALPSQLLPNFASILTAKFKGTAFEGHSCGKGRDHGSHFLRTDQVHLGTPTHCLPCQTARNIALHLPPPCSQITRLQIFSSFLLPSARNNKRQTWVNQVI